MRRGATLAAALALAALPARAEQSGGGGVSSFNSLYGAVQATAGTVGAAPCPGTCAEREAWLTALETAKAGAALLVRTRYPGRIGAFVQAGDSVATFAQAQTGLTSSQMTAVFQAAGAAVNVSGVVSTAVPPTAAQIGAAAADLSNVAPATGRAALGLGALATLGTADTATRTATGSTTARTVAAAAADILWGADNGIVCDGTTEIGTPLQALVNRVAPGMSATIMLPAGTCSWNVAVTVSGRVVHIKGQGWTENGPGSTGTWLKTTNTAISPLTVSQTGASGTSLEDVGLAQGQPAPAAGWAPTVYPPFVNVQSAPGFRVRNVMGWGVYEGFLLYNVGRFDIQDVVGQFFHNVVKADRGLDLGRIVGVHDWPYWINALGILTGPGFDAVIAWQQANKDTIILGRQDGVFLDRIFTFAARGGVRFITGAEGGVASGVDVASLQCDSVVHCLLANGAAGVEARLGYLRSFGQAGAASGAPYADADAIRVDTTSTLNLQGGDVRAGLEDTAVIRVDNTTAASNLYLHSVQAFLMAGATGSAVIAVAATNAGVAPHIVTVDAPLNISLRSGSYLAPVNWANTNAQVRIPGLDYQIVENATAAAFNGNTYQIENGRPRLILEADDGNAVSSLTVRLPKYPFDGQEASVTATMAITSLTVNDPNGRPIVGAPSSLAAGARATFKWTNTGSAIVWFRQ